jgi:hypothetical protein
MISLPEKCESFQSLLLDLHLICSKHLVISFHISVKECARAEGVLVKLGVALESTADLSHKNGVPETAEYYEKVPCDSARPHIDFVLGRSVTGTCMTRADTCIEEHASGVWFSLTSVVHFTTFLDHLD